MSLTELMELFAGEVKGLGLAVQMALPGHRRLFPS